MFYYSHVIRTLCFGEQVDLNWSTPQAAPAEGVDLTVSTGEAEAYVGLLVVDMSVLLLKEGNDLTNERVRHISLVKGRVLSEGISIFILCFF